MGLNAKRPARGHVAFDTGSIRREMEYIVSRALEADARVVALGPLVLFSTAGGDAWILDPSDGRAHCLCRGGARMPLAVTDRDDQIAIEWTGSCRIEGDAFTFADSEGRIRTVLGYPTRQIQAAAAGTAP